MKLGDSLRSHSQQGYALMSVVIFIIVILIGGMTFFAMSSYETRQAIYRQNSSEAFYLADGAVERARAAFLADGTWRDGFSDASAGNGEYDLAVTDTTFGGVSDALKLLATGRVRDAVRRIEVIAALKPTALGLTLLVMGDADVGGSLELKDGGSVIHINGDPGTSAQHVQNGEVTSGFQIQPPAIFTDPAHFPDATYYFVRGNKIGGQYQARIYNELGIDITTALGDSLTDVTSYDPARKAFTYTFDKQDEIEQYFNDTTGVFKRLPGDRAVVVNFGEMPIVSPPGPLGVSELVFDGNANSTIHASIVNTRFTGVTTTDRYDSSYWLGGLTTVKQITFEPYHGIALIAHDFQKQGSSHVQIGTEAWPALLYVTGDAVALNSNYEHIGGLITLGSWHSTGNPQVLFNSGFFTSIPGWLVESWNQGESATLRILRWREIASSP